MARKQERKYISFNLAESQVVKENERILNKATTPQQTQTPVAPVSEATEQTEAAEPAEAVAPIVQPQPQVQQPEPQVQQQPIAQTAKPIGMTSAGNRSKRTEQGITVIVPMEYYEQIALMKMRTGIPIRDIALQAVIEFVDKHKND
jgi:LAS superfamily LD-carboxypeptidase LdcB